MILQINIRTLCNFVVCCEEMHVGRAAERLGVAQPALSQQIKSLEEKLGVKLFKRGNRSIRLTEAGGVFYSEARKIVEMTDNAATLAREAERGMAGELRVGYCGSALFDQALQSVISTFMETYPKVKIAMSEKNPVENVEALEGGLVDISFIRGPIMLSTSTLRVSTFSMSPLVLALPSSHHLASRRVIDVASLAGEPMVSLLDPPGFGLAQSLHQLGDRGGFTPNIVIEAGSVAGLLGLVGAGFGIGVVPELPFKFSVSTVVIRKLSDHDANTNILMAQKKNNPSKILRKFADIIGDYARTSR